jgi:hypothetical protein
VLFITGSLGGRVFIFPALQLNLINSREDEEIFTQILSHVSENEGIKMDFCSGYLNPMPSYIDLIK